MKNGAKTLRRCLESLVNQTLKPVEIIILDSESADESVLIAKEFEAKVVTIPAGTFNHGLTRNIGVQISKGNLLFLTVQDAWLAEPTMIGKMAVHFNEKEVQGVTGHQAIPHEKDKNPFFWFNRISVPAVSKRYVGCREEFLSFSLEEQKKLTAWDNVVSMYRKSALLELPFIATEFAEDCIWSKTALLKGWTLIYDPSVMVYHYHHQTYKYAYHASFILDYHLYKFLEFTPSVNSLVKPLLQVTWHLLKNRKLSYSEKLYWILHNYVRLFAVFNARIDFIAFLHINGNKGIEKRYRKVCKGVPQGSVKE